MTTIFGFLFLQFVNEKKDNRSVESNHMDLKYQRYVNRISGMMHAYITWKSCGPFETNYTYTLADTCTHTHTHMNMHICMHTHTYSHMCTCRHTHTHKYTHEKNESLTKSLIGHILLVGFKSKQCYLCCRKVWSGAHVHISCLLR